LITVALLLIHHTGVYEESASWVCPTPLPPGECLNYEDFPPRHANELEVELPGKTAKCVANPSV